MEVTAGRGKTETLIGLTLTAVRVGVAVYTLREPNAEAGMDLIQII